MSDGKRIIEGLQDALDYSRGCQSRGKAFTVSVPHHIDVRKIRGKLRMSQEEFSLRFGFSLGTLRNWEQGTRQPQGPSRVLLTLIDRIPVEVQEALTTEAA